MNLNWFRNLKTGAVTGLGATENNIKMSGAVLGPFLGMWLVIQMFLPDALYDLAITISMFIWLAYVVMLWAWAKSDASGYIPFPQSKWKFHDGTCRTFDLMVPPDSWELIAELPNGKKAYKVYFSRKYLYQDPDLPFPDIFDMAYWILPSLWDRAFQRRAFGEFYHKAVFVQHPACEDISVYVVDWETKEGERFPVCLINDCALSYQKALETYRTPELSDEGLKLGEVYQMLYADGRKREGKLLDHAGYLEERLLVAEQESSKDWKKSVDKRMKAIRSRHARIMDTNPPLLTRILNMKTLTTVALILVFLYVVGRFVFHWW